MIKNLFNCNKFNGLQYCMVGLILGLMYAFPASSEVCFLPSGGCQSSMTMASTSSTDNGYKLGNITGGDCVVCKGRTYCKCSGSGKVLKGSQCYDCSGYSIDAQSKGIMSSNGYTCTACDGDSSLGKFKCTCSKDTEYTSGGIKKCVDCSAYTLNTQNKNTMVSNGYTCSACDGNDATGKYKCSCASSKEEVTVGGVKKCLAKCGTGQTRNSSGTCVCSDSKKEIVNGQCVCKSIYRTYNNTCYEQCESPKVASGANCTCPTEYSHTKASNETCSGGCVKDDGKRYYKTSECQCSSEYTHTKQSDETCTGGCTDKNGTKYKASECSKTCTLQTCSSKFTLTSAPTFGYREKCTDCSGTKYKCADGDTLYTFGPDGNEGIYCWHGCDSFNFMVDPEQNPDGYTSVQFVKMLEEGQESNCPTGTDGNPTGPIFVEQMFDGTPLKNVRCVACEDNSWKDDIKKASFSTPAFTSTMITYTVTPTVKYSSNRVCSVKISYFPLYNVSSSNCNQSIMQSEASNLPSRTEVTDSITIPANETSATKSISFTSGNCAAAVSGEVTSCSTSW